MSTACGPKGGGRGSGSGGCPDVILSSSHTKKMTFLYQNFVVGRSKKWKFFVNINE